jgi:hypothetical protein
MEDVTARVPADNHAGFPHLKILASEKIARSGGTLIASVGALISGIDPQACNFRAPSVTKRRNIASICSGGGLAPLSSHQVSSDM